MVHTSIKSMGTVFIAVTVISMDADASLHGRIHARHCNKCGVYACTYILYVPCELLLGFSVLRRPTYYIHVAVHS